MVYIGTDVGQYVSLAKQLGSAIEDVQGGGGNISLKCDDGCMYIKSSGTLLRDMSCDNLGSKVDAVAIGNVVSQEEYLSIPLLQQDELLAETIQRHNTSPQTRPSIETSMHIALPKKFVFHNHSVYINIFSCASSGREFLQDISPYPFIYVPSACPGADLSNKIVHAYAHQPSDVLVLESHGIVIQSDAGAAISGAYHGIVHHIKTWLTDKNIPFLSNNVIGIGGTRLYADLYPKNMLLSLFVGNNIVKHIYPDSAVFAKDLTFDGVTSGMDGTVIRMETGNAKKDAAVLENLVAINYILYVHELLGWETRYLASEQIDYILGMSQEKYRQSLYKK